MAVHILIVEDTKSLGESIADLLRMEGFDVSLAINAEEAISFLSRGSTDLIITDLVMPGMNGIGFIKYVRSAEKHKHIPIILLTAQTGPENRLAGESAGSNAFLGKPFDEDELLEIIHRLIIR